MRIQAAATPSTFGGWFEPVLSRVLNPCTSTPAAVALPVSLPALQEQLNWCCVPRPFVRAAVFDKLPAEVQPLFRHWVDREWAQWGVDDSGTERPRHLTGVAQQQVARL